MAYSDIVFCDIRSVSGSCDNFKIGFNDKKADGKLYLTNNHPSVGVVELSADVVATLLSVVKGFYHENAVSAEAVSDILKLALNVKHWDVPKYVLDSNYDYALKDGVLTLDFVTATFDKARDLEAKAGKLFEGEVTFSRKFPILELRINATEQPKVGDAGTSSVLSLWVSDIILYELEYYCAKVLQSYTADEQDVDNVVEPSASLQSTAASQNVVSSPAVSESVATVPAHLAEAPEINRSSTFWVEICIAGPVDVAKQVIRKHVAEVGLCVTVTPTDYLYSYGEESGYIVRLINYPRFPTTAEKLIAKAEVLAQKLMVETAQGSFTLVTPVDTIFYSKRPQDQKK